MRTAAITSHTSGPWISPVRRPLGPSRKTTPGWASVRRPSSTKSAAALEVESPGCLPAYAVSLLNASGSKRRDRGLVMATVQLAVVKKVSARSVGQ